MKYIVLHFIKMCSFKIMSNFFYAQPSLYFCLRHLQYIILFPTLKIIIWWFNWVWEKVLKRNRWQRKSEKQRKKSEKKINLNSLGLRIIELADNFLVVSNIEILLKYDFNWLSMWMRTFLFPKLSSQTIFVRIHFLSFSTIFLKKRLYRLYCPILHWYLKL